MADKPNWYEKNGVEPPQNIPHLSEEEFEKRFREAGEIKHGKWKQVGNMLNCGACGNHGFLISTDHILTGTDEQGLPILKDISKMQP